MTDQPNDTTFQNKICLYDVMLACVGLLGALITVLLWKWVGTSMILAASIGVNASLFVWAYTLHEGWHNVE